MITWTTTIPCVLTRQWAPEWFRTTWFGRAGSPTTEAYR